jgi:hypothetical protein
MTEPACHSINEGEVSCVTGQHCTCNEQKTPISLIPGKRSRTPQEMPQHLVHSKSIRSVLWMGIACLTSPCCTPLFVPFALTLLAGTPIALWLTHILGWIYGVLTLISVCSLLLAFGSFIQKPDRSSWLFKRQK